MIPNNLNQHDAFMKLFLANQRGLLRYVMYLVPNANDAREIVQNTSFALWKKFEQYAADHKDAETLLPRLMKRAYRRVPEEAEVQRCLAYAVRAIEDKACVQDAMRLAYKAVLCSPDFLDFQEAPGVLDGHALATRLSYTLWRSMPDSELIASAEFGSNTDRIMSRRRR